MSRATWGIGRPVGGGYETYQFRGRAGVVIEMAPNQFFSYVITGSHGTIDIIDINEEREVHSWRVLDPIYVATTREIELVIKGTLSSSEEQAQRPAWADHVAGELTARHELEGR